MRLNEIAYNDAKPIDGYGPGFFRIGGEIVEGPIILSAQGCSAWAGYDDLDGLLKLAGQVDVLFIGTGAEITHLPAEFRSALEGAELGVEPMSSPAACRTYNILLSEGRRIAAALFPV